MKKIDFVNGTTVNGAETFNEIQDNIEEVFNGNEPMGSIVVEDISCKNILDISNFSITKSGLTISYNNGTFTFNGTPTSNITLDLTEYIDINKLNSLVNGKQVAFSMQNHSDNSKYSTLWFRTTDDTYYLQVKNDKLNTTKTITEELTGFWSYIGKDVTYNNVTFNLQLEFGDTVTDYVEHKKFSFTAPIIQEATATDFTLATGYGGGNLCKVYANKDGYAIATTFVNFAGNSTGLRQLYIRKNNTTISGAVSMRPPSNDAITLSITEVFKCSKGDEITCYVKQISGADMVISGNLRVLII